MPTTNRDLSPVLVDRTGPVLVITLNRPEAKNAANHAMASAMSRALDQLEGDDSLSCAVLTGAGGNFCAGMDLKAFVAGETPLIPGRGFLALTESPSAKPLVAAVEGYALAGGFETALACDLIIASEEARFGLPETKRGLVAAAGGLMRLPERVATNVAMELALTGEMLDAARAHALGLVNRTTSPGQALPVALEVASAIAANGPLAVRVSKQVIFQSRDWPLSERTERQAALTDPVFASSDALEGARAFAEKRPPRWTGH